MSGGGGLMASDGHIVGIVIIYPILSQSMI